VTPDLRFVATSWLNTEPVLWRASCGYFHFVIGLYDNDAWEAIYWVKRSITHKVDGSPFRTFDQATAGCEIMLQKLVNHTR